MASWIQHWADCAGDRDAVVGPERRLSYAALEDRVARLASVLREAGVGPGDRVAILLANRSAYLEAVFAAARIGAVSLPINTRLAPREVSFLLDDCTPRALLHEAQLAELVEGSCAAAAHAPALRLAVGGAPDAYEEALRRARPREGVLAVSPEAPMMLMYTSGTTGRPKGALLPHRKTLYNSLNAQLYFGITPDDRVLVAAPLFHSLGLAILSLPALYAGAAVLLHARFDAEAVWRAVAEEGVTYLGGVPTMYQRLHDALGSAPSTRRGRAGLRFLFTAGAAVSPELVRTYHGRGLTLIQGYGQTETSILCCLDPPNAVRKAGSVGRPVFHAELRVVRTDGIEGPTSGWRDSDAGETGEIVVRGPVSMLGYWQRPEESAETLREDGWLRTGDLATRDDEGFITLAGRARELFISGGENVYPAEVEAVLSAHPAIREIAVVGVPDPRWGEVGEAYVVLSPGCTLDPAGLTAWARERLAKFKLPQRFVSVTALPRTASGKVQKHRLVGTRR